MTIDISKFVQVPALKWIGGASYAFSEDTLFGRYEVERLASDSEWFLSCGRWEGGVHPSLDAAKAAAQADYAARKLAGLTPTPALVALINERHKLRAALSDLLADAEWLDREYGDERECDGRDRGDEPESFINARATFANAPQCCMCGKTGLSTVEGDGGSECQLSDGRWTCSFECWERATESASLSHS